MTPITVWLRYEGATRRYEHNHIEDGHVPHSQRTPTPMCDEQRRAWQRQEWVRRYRYLDAQYRVCG